MCFIRAVINAITGGRYLLQIFSYIYLPQLKTMFFKSILLLLFCVAILNCGFCQQYTVPQNVQLHGKEDYIKYESDIIATANWLEVTPVGNDDAKRKQANTFLMQWVTGSSTVNVNVNADFIGKLCDKNPDLLMMFMAGYTRNALQNNYDTSSFNGNLAGVKGVIMLYKLGGKIQKNRFVLSAIHAMDQGKLENWVKANMDKTQ